MLVILRIIRGIMKTKMYITIFALFIVSYSCGQYQFNKNKQKIKYVQVYE